MRLQADSGARKVLMVWISAAGMIAVALISALAGFFTSWLLILSGLIGALTVFAFLWYPPRYVSSMNGSFDGTAVRAVKGVIWKQELYVPVSALRTFEISATPVQRLFRCRSVILRFAGGAVLIPLLPKQQAEQLEKIMEAYDQ